MHINAKRMQRRINKSTGKVRSSTMNEIALNSISTEPETIRDHTDPPEYLKITDYESQAAALGLIIERKKETAEYTIKGAVLNDFNEDELTAGSLQELKSIINDLWDISTEPHIECYLDNNGRFHERLIYPNILA